MLIQDFGCLHKKFYRCKLKWANKDPINFYGIVEAPAKTKNRMLFYVCMKEMLDNSRGKRCKF